MNPKTAVIWLLALITFLSGAIVQYFHQRHAQLPPFAVLSVPTYAFLLFLWYRLDAEQRSYRRSYLLNVCVAGLVLIGLPYYFLRSRGAKGGFAATVLFILSFPASLLVSLAGQFLVFSLLRNWH